MIEWINKKNGGVPWLNWKKRTVNSAMVEAYRQIGKAVHEACGENDRAAYGKQVLKILSERLTAEFGKGFSISALRTMRQFYYTFPI